MLPKRLMQFSASVHMMGLALIYRQEEGGCGCGGCEAGTEEHPLFGQKYALVAQRLCPKVRASFYNRSLLWSTEQRLVGS